MCRLSIWFVRDTLVRAIGALTRWPVGGRTAWYINNQIVWASLSYAKPGLLASGTTSNEALHAELNNCFRQTVRLHRSSLLLKLKIFQMVKIIPHVSALVSPAARQNTQANLLARAVAMQFVSPRAWDSACEKRSGRPLRRAVLDLDGRRAFDRDRVRTWMRFHNKHCRAWRARKRTVFTQSRKRLFSMQGARSSR